MWHFIQLKDMYFSPDVAVIFCLDVFCVLLCQILWHFIQISANKFSAISWPYIPLQHVQYIKKMHCRERKTKPSPNHGLHRSQEQNPQISSFSSDAKHVLHRPSGGSIVTLRLNETLRRNYTIKVKKNESSVTNHRNICKIQGCCV